MGWPSSSELLPAGNGCLTWHDMTKAARRLDFKHVTLNFKITLIYPQPLRNVSKLSASKPRKHRHVGKCFMQSRNASTCLPQGVQVRAWASRNQASVRPDPLGCTEGCGWRAPWLTTACGGCFVDGEKPGAVWGSVMVVVVVMIMMMTTMATMMRMILVYSTFTRRPVQHTYVSA